MLDAFKGESMFLWRISLMFDFDISLLISNFGDLMENIIALIKIV